MIWPGGSGTGGVVQARREGSGTEKGPRKAWGGEGQALLCVDGVLFALVDDL